MRYFFYLVSFAIVSVTATYWALQTNNAGQDPYLDLTFPKYDLVTYDNEEITEDLRKAAESGDLDSQFKLGLLLTEEASTLEEPGEYSEWLTRAAKAGHPGAANELGNAYKYGQWGLANDPAAAFKFFLISAKGGDEVGLYNLAIAYRDGVGAARNDELAARAFIKSAQLGYPASQFAVYLIMREGVGVTQSLKTALRAARAANRQDMDASRFFSESVFKNEMGSSTKSYLVAHNIAYKASKYSEFAMGLRCIALGHAKTKTPNSTSNKFGGGDQDRKLSLEEFSELLKGVFESMGDDFDAEAIRIPLIRAASIMGDPVAQSLYSDHWREQTLDESAELEAIYWRNRSIVNPLHSRFPAECG
ncbi:MAG: sel1 repeat family protein [Parvularculaceae bacterium]|nr:sel1 repeat family protein [Parvularculaceae bacterium]